MARVQSVSNGAIGGHVGHGRRSEYELRGGRENVDTESVGVSVRSLPRLSTTCDACATLDTDLRRR